MRIYTNAIAFYFLRFQWWKGREDNEEIEGNRYYQAGDYYLLLL